MTINEVADQRLWAIELDIVGPAGSRCRRAQTIVRIVADAELLAAQAQWPVESVSPSDELLDLLNRVSTPGAKKLVMESLAYLRQDIELTHDISRYLQPSVGRDLALDKKD